MNLECVDYTPYSLQFLKHPMQNHREPSRISQKLWTKSEKASFPAQLVYLNSRSNLGLSFSEGLSLFLHFPRFFLTIVINLIIRCQSISSPFQNIFKKMCSNRKCKTLESAQVPKKSNGKSVIISYISSVSKCIPIFQSSKI